MQIIVLAGRRKSFPLGYPLLARVLLKAKVIGQMSLKLKKMRMTKKYYFSKPILSLVTLLHSFVLGFSLVSSHTALAMHDEDVSCTQTLSDVAPIQQIKTIDDLCRAFTSGLEVNLNEKNSEQAFEIYRKLKFGNPNTSLLHVETGVEAVDIIKDELQKHPNLEKGSFRNYQVEILEKEAPVTESLKLFIGGQLRSSSDCRKELFNIPDHPHFWKETLQYQPPTDCLAKVQKPIFKTDLSESPESRETRIAQYKIQNEIYKKEQQRIKDAILDDYKHWIDTRITPAEQALASDSARSPEERTRYLHDVLVRERLRLQREGKNIQFISRAIVNLIHGIGYQNPKIIEELGSPNGYVRLKGFQKILQERDRFSEQVLHYPGHFSDVLKTFGISEATGIESFTSVTEKLQSLEKELSELTIETQTSKSVRHLSLTESPYRSCLGGSDCSSRTYPTGALDPNYHYFTLTDSYGHSSGQITIVLGEADTQDGKMRCAFVDKIQNVQPSNLDAMIEAIRLSVAEKNYTLVMPKDLGIHNGISNDDFITQAIRNLIPIDKNKTLKHFIPHPHDYKFDYRFSRATQNLDLHPILPIAFPENRQVKAAKLNHKWTLPTGSINLKSVIEATNSLKNGTEEDQLNYLSAMFTGICG